jgi:hypothetical protein
MDFGEFMVVAVVMGVLFVVFPAVVFNGIARIKAAKARAGGGGDALRMSELNSMIDEAVQRETAELRGRIEVLEEIATSRHDDFKLLEGRPPTLALPEPDDQSETASASSRTTTRA